MIDVKPNIFSLSNGLRVIHIPTDKFNSAMVLLLGKAGRRSEPDEEVGAAHFLEHLLFDGTRKRPSAFEINKVIEQEGVAKNGVTSQESVAYWIKILPERIEVAFDFLSDIIFNSLLRDTDIDKEKKVISQEAMMKKDDPDDLLYRMHLKMLYPSQNIGRNILDEWKVIDQVDRSQVAQFLKRNYTARNFVLAIVGNIGKKLAIKLADKHFSAMRPGKEIQYPAALFRSEKYIEIENRDFEQTKLALSFRGYSLGEDDMYTARMLAIILGAGFSSRLYDRLRNKNHLVYSIGVRNIDFTDTGYFNIETKTSEDRLQMTINQILEESRRIAKEPVELWELDRAKNRLKSWFVFNMDDISFYTWHFSEQLLFKNEVEDIELTLGNIMKTNQNDIQRVAKYIFSDRPKVSLLTPKLKSFRVN